MLTTLVMLTGCGTNGVEQATEPAAVVPTDLVGTWSVTGAGVERDTTMRIGSGFGLGRKCGESDGEWSASRTGGFLATVGSGPESCDLFPAWLEDAVAFGVDGDNRVLLDSRQKVLARLAPQGDGGEPYYPLSEGERALLEAQPPPLPAPLRAATSAEILGGFWMPVNGQPADLTFNADRSWNGSDGCNDIGGRWQLDRPGELLAHSMDQTLKGCDNVPVSTWMALASTAAFDGEILVLRDALGQELTRLKKTQPQRLAQILPPAT